jgi:hypothetical protein
VRDDIQQHNPYYDHYRNFATFLPEREDVYMALAHENPSHDIVAMYHTGFAPQCSHRTVYVQRAADSAAQQIHILNPLYEPLQYPLLFPHGSLGWGTDIRYQCSQITYYKYLLLTEPRFRWMSRLGCKWICDMYSCTMDERLNVIRGGKSAERHTFGMDEVDEEEDDEDDYNTHEATQNRRSATYCLPASFTGSAKYYANQVADALSLAHQLGKPNLFITVTCNPNWPELLSKLEGRSTTEVPQITTRVFKVLHWCSFSIPVLSELCRYNYKSF